jgi:hypothetical protein
MRTLLEYAGKKRREKRSTQASAAKYWATFTWPGEKLKVLRSDGSVTTDKTAGFHSRPGYKESIRNGNRRIKKAGRQALKREMNTAANER